MKTSESIKNIATALLTAQLKISTVKKDAVNPFFKSTYADLPSVIDAVKGPLNEVGIFVLQPCTHRDGKNFINTVLIHAESSEFVESETEVIVTKNNDPQAFGAAQTYARRFALQTMLFLPAEDDDGNTAAARAAPQVAASTAKATPTAAKAKSSFRKENATDALSPVIQPEEISKSVSEAEAESEWT